MDPVQTVQYMFDYFQLTPHMNEISVTTVLYGLYLFSIADGSAGSF
jgi:hypothetical protein